MDYSTNPPFGFHFMVLYTGMIYNTTAGWILDAVVSPEGLGARKGAWNSRTREFGARRQASGDS